MTSEDSVVHHLLVVDDDLRLRTLLQRYLVKNGYWCSCARDGQHAIQLLDVMQFDLAIVDVMMPRMDGFDLTAHIRKTDDLPIIVLTARTELDDHLTGFAAGADDYMKKPYEPQELVARIEAILRRTKKDELHKETATIQLGKLEFDTYRGLLRSSDGESVHLTGLELRLLRRLAQTPNVAVSRDEFTNQLSDSDEPILDRAVDIRVSRLRQKLEINPRRPRFLLTIRNEGYMLVPE